jgi:hypothetical protein
MEQVTFLSYGGGVDSSALLAMHMDRDKAAQHLGISREELDDKFPPFEAAVFSDPGSEWPETYENIAYAEAKCALAGVRLETVRFKQTMYFHTETGERLRRKEWRELPKEEKANYEARIAPYTIYEWLIDSKAFPLMPGRQHVCSMKFKGEVQQKWADKEFGDHTVCTKTWMLGIELSEEGRSERFTANRRKTDSKAKKILGHEYRYPLMELKMNRKECLEMLDHLGWDYRGDGSPVQKSSCMWCPFVKEWEVDRLIDTDGTGLEEALKIEERFYSTDKHAAWHEAGEPLNKGGTCFAGNHRQPYATGYCAEPGCADHNKHGKATLVQIRYPNDGSQPHAKGTVRKTLKQHLKRRKRAKQALQEKANDVAKAIKED